MASTTKPMGDCILCEQAVAEVGIRGPSGWVAHYPCATEYARRLKNPVRIIHIPVAEAAAFKEVPAVPSQLRKLVGGWLEEVKLGPRVSLVINEDGIRKDLPINFAATRLLEGKVRMAHGAVRGDAFIARYDEDGHQVSVTEDDIEAWLPRA